MKAAIRIAYRIIKPIRKRLRQALLRAQLNKCGENFRIYGRARIDMAGLVSLGNNVSLNEGSLIIARHAPVTIGDNVTISAAAIITSAGHDYKGDSPHARHESKPVVIKNNAWIGANAIILPGVTIGEGSVIAASAVVTKNVAANTLVAGIPTKPIKSITKS